MSAIVYLHHSKTLRVLDKGRYCNCLGSLSMVQTSSSSVAPSSGLRRSVVKRSDTILPLYLGSLSHTVLLYLQFFPKHQKRQIEEDSLYPTDTNRVLVLILFLFLSNIIRFPLNRIFALFMSSTVVSQEVKTNNLLSTGVQI